MKCMSKVGVLQPSVCCFACVAGFSIYFGWLAIDKKFAEGNRVPV